jgi:hypothetical protein
MNFIFNEFKTIHQIFSNIAVFVCPRTTNFVLFASKIDNFDKKKLLKNSEILDKKYKWNFKLTPFLSTRLEKNYIDSNIKDATIITDEFAPK